LSGMLLIDPDRASAVEDALLAIDRSGRIAYAGKARDDIRRQFERRGYERRSLAGHSVLPPLIDAHVHLDLNLEPGSQRPGSAGDRALDNLRTALADGITTLRDCGAADFALNVLKDRCRRDQKTDLFISGPPLTTQGGHMHNVGWCVQEVGALRAAVDRLAAGGADFVKICATGGMLTRESNPRGAQYSTGQLRAVVEQAAQHGLKVTAHAHGAAGIRNCIAAGVHSIEHCSFLGAIDGRDLDETLLAEMARRGIFLGGTITRSKCDVDPETVRRVVDGEPIEPFWFFRHLYRRALAAGVELIISSDAGFPGNDFGHFYKRLKTAVDVYGLTVMDTLKAVTATAARMLGLARQNFRPGQAADLVVVAGDVRGDIGALAHVKLVVSKGQAVYDPASGSVMN